jgi:hypothetical protein
MDAKKKETKQIGKSKNILKNIILKNYVVIFIKN